jgi:hypothetical protein
MEKFTYLRMTVINQNFIHKEIKNRLNSGNTCFNAVSRPVLGPTQPPIQWVPGDLSLAVKRLEREADHPPPSNAKVKECMELYLHSPNMP